MSPRSETGIFNEEDVFRLKVAEIVYSVLKERDLTINEVKKIKEAINESLELVFANHELNCQKLREDSTLKLIDKKFENHRQELEEKIKAAVATAKGDSGTALASFKTGDLVNIIKNKFTEYRLEVLQEQEKKRAEERAADRARTHKTLGICFTIFGIVLAIIQLVLKLTGVL